MGPGRTGAGRKSRQENRQCAHSLDDLPMRQLPWWSHVGIPIPIFPLQIVFYKMFEFLGSAYSLCPPPSTLAYILGNAAKWYFPTWWQVLYLANLDVFFLCLAAACLSCTNQPFLKAVILQWPISAISELFTVMGFSHISTCAHIFKPFAVISCLNSTSQQRTPGTNPWVT